MKPIYFRIFSLLVLTSLLFGCAGVLSEEGVAKSPQINPPLEIPPVTPGFPENLERNPAVEPEYEPVGENESLRIYINRQSSAVIIEDKRSRVLWRTSPADLQEDKNTTNVWRRQIEVPIQVSFVNAERSQPKNVKPGQANMNYQPIQDGLKISYDFPNDDLALDLIYSLSGDCLNVMLPSASIQERGENNLVSIEILPFLGATHDGEEGYIVYPDGSGALMHFNTPHPIEVQKITGIVYGSDASGGQVSGSSSSTIFRQPLPMAVFGLVRGESAFVGMVTNGDFDSGISVARVGKGINYNHVWSQFVFRRQGRFSLTGGQPAWLYQPDRIPGDRQVRYCFLNESEANYAGMAQRYRNFLINERGAHRISSQSPLMHLGFFMGTERRTWILRDMVSMTTFDQARQIIKDLADAGVLRLDVTLWMWNQGQISNRYPQRLPVEKRLGGEAALRSLADEIAQRGQRLFLLDDYLTVSPGSNNVFPYLDVIRGVDGLPIGNADQGYLLNPQVAFDRFAARDIPKMTAFGANGLELSAFASLALPDKNSRYPLSREGFAATWMEIAAMSRQLFGSVAMSGSNIYAVPYADRLDMVTLDSTHYDLFDEAVPLYHIAIHGLVQYTGDPDNLISDSQRMFLRSVEYGTIPFFILTEESSSKLARTPANSVYSSQYSFWKNEVIARYQAIESLSPLIAQFITGHEKLVEGVYQTTYEDGTRVIVNYNPEAYTDGVLNVPSMDFLVVKGD